MLIDQKSRDDILKDDFNIVVSASAGSGKTTIMVKKIELELDKITNHKTVAAITFTVKATNEIKKKASININKPFITMTNDSFIEKEIIRPFIKDALGNEYDNSYVIEYKEEYKFNTYSDGLNQLKNIKILGSFKNRNHNFNFQLAHEILKNSIAAQEYIKSKYTCFFIDEYQDSDMDMHCFFMYLKNKLGIKLFIVGDSKQAIYTWRGAMTNIFKLLEKENFNFYELVTNFRCHKEIENYANLFHNQNYFVPNSNIVENVICKDYSSYNIENFSGFIDQFKNLLSSKIIDLNKEITIIANFNNDAKTITKLLNEEGFKFIFIPKTPIDEGIPNGHLLRQLAIFSKNSIYTIYDFLENIDIDERNVTRFEINNIIKNLKDNKNLNLDIVIDIISKLANYLELSIDKYEIDKFYESISYSEYDMAFRLVNSKHKVMTVFGSKGLEFDQVISFSHYYEIYNNNNMQNHYVCITRAKEKFVMFLTDNNYFNYIKSISNTYNVQNINNLIKLLM